MTHKNDNLLRSQRNDEWLEQIVAEFSRPLRGYFRRRVNSLADADDLVQDVFARLSRLEDPAEVNNAAAYVFSIAANLLRDRARRAGARLADSHEPYDEAEHGGAGRETPEINAIALEDLNAVARVIASLPTKTQTVFLLHRFDGLKYREIAEVTGSAVSTIEKHMIAALAALAKNVKGDVR
ncbi:MAG: RNA polymerase sigma factor [Pseudomonadota bacterium]